MVIDLCQGVKHNRDGRFNHIALVVVAAYEDWNIGFDEKYTCSGSD